MIVINDALMKLLWLIICLLPNMISQQSYVNQLIIVNLNLVVVIILNLSNP